jgi:hypothetical protein
MLNEKRTEKLNNKMRDFVKKEFANRPIDYNDMVSFATNYACKKSGNYLRVKFEVHEIGKKPKLEPTTNEKITKLINDEVDAFVESGIKLGVKRSMDDVVDYASNIACKYNCFLEIDFKAKNFPQGDLSDAAPEVNV